MRRVLITGANGTVGKAMIAALKVYNSEIILWDRNETDPFDFGKIQEYIKDIKPTTILHFAMASKDNGIENESWKINHDWTRDLAFISAEYNIRFLFTSTALVFSNDAKGPFTLQSIPDAREGYGYEKLKAEQIAFQCNKNSYIIRLGWQIGNNYEGNNMLAHFEREQIKYGKVIAGNLWKPACSFLTDTVKEILRIITEEHPGLYLLDANDGFSFFEIASYLNKMNHYRWNIVQDSTYIFDQRMLDNHSKIEKLSEKIKLV